MKKTMLRTENIQQRASRIVSQLRNLGNILGPDFLKPVGKIRVHRIEPTNMLEQGYLGGNRFEVKVDYKTRSKRDEPELSGISTCEELGAESISFERKRNGNVEVKVEFRANDAEEENALINEIRRLAGIEHEPLVEGPIKLAE